MLNTKAPKKKPLGVRAARLATTRSRLKKRKMAAAQLDEATVQRGVSSDGYVVYGSPAKPTHASMDRILRAVLAVKA